VTELPAGGAEAGLGVTLATWEYGSLAEILRLGTLLRGGADRRPAQVVGEVRCFGRC
jgi:hypothetical protein